MHPFRGFHLITRRHKQTRWVLTFKVETKNCQMFERQMTSAKDKKGNGDGFEP